MYEWSCGELEESPLAPRIHFCERCHGLFIVTPEEVAELQRRFRQYRERTPLPIDPLLNIDPARERERKPPERARPLDRDRAAGPPQRDDQVASRSRILITEGRFAGRTGIIAVIGEGEAIVRFDDDGRYVRMALSALWRL